MLYSCIASTKQGQSVLIRSATDTDAFDLLQHFKCVLRQSKYLMLYPDEVDLTVEREQAMIRNKLSSNNEVFLLAVQDGNILGSADIRQIGSMYKVRHRAGVGIAVNKIYWGQGIGRLLMQKCIACAKKAAYTQLELDVVANNKRAIGLYKSLGFKQYAVNPRGIRLRDLGYVDYISMRLEIE